MQTATVWPRRHAVLLVALSSIFAEAEPSDQLKSQHAKIGQPSQGVPVLRPFALPPNSKDLNGQYLSSHALGTNLPSLSEMHVKHLLRLWFMQGIPFAFGPCPLLYEAIREWLAPRLGIAPLDITLIGSARIGYSSSPQKFATVFSARSDLDLAVVSKSLFERVRADFLRWQDDCDTGIARALDSNQEDNLRRLPKNLGWGFIDPNRVPVEYDEIRKVQWAMHLLKGKLKETPSAPAIAKASIRVYETREAFEQRLFVNLKATQQSLRAVTKPKSGGSV